MSVFKPSYYDEFKCIADKCKHSCCVGWEIDVDEDTAKLYENEEGEFGKKLRENIEDGHFKLGENERCPFLNDENLCEIIIHMGKESLCQICSDHPRFVNFVEDREEIGLGMCCGEAARIILNYKDKVKISGENLDENVIINTREKIFQILQNRDKSIDERVMELLITFNISIPKLNWQKIYMGLERLDKEWTKKLLGLNDERKVFAKNWDLPFEQILVYFIYRHLTDGIYDNTINERIKFSVLSFYMIRELFAHGEETIEELIEICRMYSSEVEYSEENMERLLYFLKF